MELELILGFVLGAGATTAASGLVFLTQALRRRDERLRRIRLEAMIRDGRSDQARLLDKLMEAQRDLAQAQLDIDEVSVALQRQSD